MGDERVEGDDQEIESEEAEKGMKKKRKIISSVDSTASPWTKVYYARSILFDKITN